MLIAKNNSEAALTWVSKILEERFGYTFNLRIEQHNKLLIFLDQYSSTVQVLLDCETFTRADSNLPYTHWDATAEGWDSVLASPLPAPGASSLPSPLIKPTDQGMHVAYDILGLTYWMLNRQEEVGRTDLDEHGRFSAESSHAYKYGYLERPVVDEWLHILGQVMQRTWPEIKLLENIFRMRVSHDVDQPSLYAFKSPRQIARMMAGHLLKRHDLKAFFQAPYIKFTSSQRISSADPFNTFEWIMDLSEKYNLTSVFYFICGHTDPHDADYQTTDPRIRRLLRRIHERGHEIGLHPSYGSYQKPRLISQEAELLRRICEDEGIRQTEWGGRMHYLRWEQPTTLQAFCDAGMNYDSTMSYADRPGFRCGTCFDYPAFNIITQKILPLRIMPLVMMECTVIENKYMGLGKGGAALDKALSLKNTCRKVGGTFTLLWHNSNLVSTVDRSFYEQLLV